jgi:integrase
VTDLFPTNTGGIVAGSHLWRKKAGLLDELGFPPGLDFHSLRRAYTTNLLAVYGYDLTFASLQLGHEHAATTSIHTLPAPDSQVTELARVHGETLKAAGAKRDATGKRLRLPPPPPLKDRKKNRG